MQGIVCIAGTNRPDNYTARALGIVVDELRHSRIDPLVFDARTLSLAFPGHPDPGDGERLRTAIAAALAELSGPVTIVNSDVPCVTASELEQLSAAAPALVAAPDGTTNALSLRDARDFEPLYGQQPTATAGT